MPKSLKTYEAKIKLDQRMLSKTEFDALCHLTYYVADNSRILEIGSFTGNSTMAFIFATIDTNIEITCIDTWTGEPDHTNWTGTSKIYQENNVFKEFKKNVNSVLDKPERLKIIVNNIRYIKPEELGKFNLIFIDANHETREVIKDIVFSLQCLKKGGILCGHDYREGNGVAEAIDEIQLPVHIFKNTSIWVKADI